MTAVAEQPSGRLTPPAGRLRGLGYPLAVWAGSRVAVYLVVAAQNWTDRRPRQTGVSWNGLFGSLGDWDATWYGWIAHHGYDPSIGHGNTAAFFPLYPSLWWPLTALPGPATLWATALSSLLFAAGLCALYRITEGRYDEHMARRTVLYLAIFPLSFVFSLPYAESLFLLCALGAFALTWHGRWWWGCAVGALAVLARPVGIALVPALAWRRYRECGLRPISFLPLLLLPAAELAFFGYLYWRTGDPLAHFHAQVRGWGRGVSVLPVVVVKTAWDTVHDGHLRYLVHLGFTLLWCGLWYHAWRRMRIAAEYLIYAGLLILLPTTGGLIVSMGRFGMVGFPFFWALADLGRDERVDTVIKVAFPLMMATLIFITFGPKTFTP
ncbi:MAG: hypothetical protein HY013_19330 [Candidatus Solibacter usitatus]|nr:hypothetical protein [Candidatus Solibacter usitatus]